MTISAPSDGVPAPGDDMLRRELVDVLLAVRRDALELETVWADELALVPANDRPSARNLLHYVALRQHDLRPVQRALAVRGLSSLGRAEGHVLATIDAVLGHLGEDVALDIEGRPSFESSDELRTRHTAAALGPLPAGDRVRLMVTLPTDAATDAGVIRELVEAGMDLARINCAHDGPVAWAAMADGVRAEARRVGRPVGVAFDLAGPKLRTGALEPGPPVLRVRPRRGVDGVVQRPVKVRFSATATAVVSDSDIVVVPIDRVLIDGAVVDDEIKVRDARGRRRRFSIVSTDEDAVDTTSDRTTYLMSGMHAERHRDDTRIAVGSIGELPATESFIMLERGDQLRVQRDVSVGRPAVIGADGTVVEPATVGCELASVFDAIAVGDRILIDDGTIEGRVVSVGAGQFVASVTRPQRAKLKAEKGLNLPDTAFATPALTDDDRAALAVIAPLADLVSLSFVRSVQDVVELRQALDGLGRPDIAVGLKIEHTAAFAALPRLLLHACQRPPVAVMLARGDLAIEVGFERLAEIQEQVLWLCEAAHIPVIWATQVAESMAKQGIPTRAEVTDAAWSSRAECVMLNKGPHIADAIRFLDGIFTRMHEHQDKQTSLLRRLSISDAFRPDTPASDFETSSTTADPHGR